MISTQISILENSLLTARDADGGWRGELASSAIATATAVIALTLADKKKHATAITRGLTWLIRNRNTDGGWGDTPESPSNVTATLLTKIALTVSDQPATANETAKNSAKNLLPELSPENILKLYGDDRTFSAPILAVGAAVGLWAWRKVPRLPYPLGLLPFACFRFLRLPVVSYALPALIAVGMTRAWSRWLFPACLRRLRALQPPSGGYLEAIPLTAFCAICLSSVELGDSDVARAAHNFLINNQRENGAWSIALNLEQWLTATAARILAGRLNREERQKLSALIVARQATTRHPYTQTAAGGWAWSAAAGAVPDADDTAAALLALHALEIFDEATRRAITRGATWLLSLQNRDGGMPTFCRGWNRLPFDRSCPDISAHVYAALTVNLPLLPTKLRAAAVIAAAKILPYLQATQTARGSWLPLWFGDQDVADKTAPVYGTAVVLEMLGLANTPISEQQIRGVKFLQQTQNANGGWGGDQDVAPKFLITARAVSALKFYTEAADAYRHGREYLLRELSVASPRPEPIGLYFSQLWYDEKLYRELWGLQALR